MREEFFKSSNFVEEFKAEDLDLFREIEVSKKKLKAFYSNLDFVNRKFNRLLCLSNKSRRSKVCISN